MEVVLTSEGARLMQDCNSEMWPPYMKFPHPLMHHGGWAHNQTWSQPSKAEKKEVWLISLLPSRY
jgi:hypothetical protein